MEPDVVEVVFALPDEQFEVTVVCTPGMTAHDAVLQSGLIERFPEISESPLVLGCFASRVDHDHRVKAGDRIEICRPLRADPRDQRRALWRDGRVMGERDS